MAKSVSLPMSSQDTTFLYDKQLKFPQPDICNFQDEAMTWKRGSLTVDSFCFTCSQLDVYEPFS